VQGRQASARAPKGARFKRDDDGGKPMPLIAIIDDDADIRDVLRTLFEERGYQVVEAADGREALAMLEQAEIKPDVLLLDLMMPMMDGWQLRAKLRQDPSLASIPIVIMSAHLALLRAIANAEPNLTVLAKPVEIERLFEIVARYSGDTRSGVQ
jgi:CheY-like chemotaxis protein